MSMPPVHMGLTASVLHPTTHTLPVPWYTLGQYAIALTIRLSLMCIAGDSVLINCINQASGGGQLTFKRNRWRRPLPILTMPYQTRKRDQWPLPSLTKSYARHAKPIGQLGLVIWCITIAYHCRWPYQMDHDLAMWSLTKHYQKLPFVTDRLG